MQESAGSYDDAMVSLLVTHAEALNCPSGWGLHSAVVGKVRIPVPEGLVPTYGGYSTNIFGRGSAYYL